MPRFRLPRRSRLPRPAARSISLSRLLPASLAGLVVAAVLPVVVIAYLFADDTAKRLVAREREAVVDRLEAQLRQLLDPVEAQMDYAARRIAEGQVRLEDEREVEAFVRGLLAGTPQVEGIGIIRPDGSMRRWERDRRDAIDEAPERLPFGEKALREGRAGDAVWSAPFYSPVLSDVILNRRVPLNQDGAFRGVLAVGVTAQRLSRTVADISQEIDVTAFVLSGRDRVLTYPGRRGTAPNGGFGAATDLPLLAGSTDPVVRAMWSDPRPVTTDADLRRTQAHWTYALGEPYAYLYRTIGGYGEPLTVVVASRSAQTRWDRWSPTFAAAAGLLLMALAATLAWALGHRLARPFRRVDTSLRAIAAMRYGDVDLADLRRSRVTEWRRTAARVEGTAAALARLTRYVPRALTERLIRADDPHTELAERDVSILFLDLEGFTPFAAARPARASAAYLARVFGCAGPIIEAHGGVIDKYTGDGLLAFWGAPGEQPDHAERALAAAAELRETWGALAASVLGGEGPRIRVGLHGGPALVGDIGFRGRVDYTITGTTVNVAERTQGALRGVEPDAPIVVGATPDFVARLPAPPPWLLGVDHDAPAALPQAAE